MRSRHILGQREFGLHQLALHTLPQLRQGSFRVIPEGCPRLLSGLLRLSNRLLRFLLQSGEAALQFLPFSCFIAGSGKISLFPVSQIKFGRFGLFFMLDRLGLDGSGFLGRFGFFRGFFGDEFPRFWIAPLRDKLLVRMLLTGRLGALYLRFRGRFCRLWRL